MQNLLKSVLDSWQQKYDKLDTVTIQCGKLFQTFTILSVKQCLVVASTVQLHQYGVYND